GVIAALTGGLFGAALQHPVVLTLVATIIAILAMGMFGIYTLELPSSVLGKLHQVAGVAGPFGLGAIAGLVAAPCVGPFVVALLTFVAASGNALIGFLCFFALSLGLGIPYLFLAIFSGSLQRLPKAGTWMEWVRKVFGFLLLGLAAYFISPLLPSRIALFIIPALAIVAGIYLGWFEKSGAESIRFQRFKSLVGLAVIALSMVSIIQRSYSLSSERIWLPFSEQRLQQAIADGKPVVIDFTAKWCAMCKKLEKRTFANPRVRAELRRFVCLKVDMTYGSLTNQNVAERYDVRGLPTVVLVDSKGREHRELRITGFISPQEFIQRLKQLR
ncbi:MAG TPA: DUF255 domain-containing protein, partial [Armatimonadetes bacterium]|nr:DUF255 domain-containing protein [Armatimonadota bacterium]